MLRKMMTTATAVAVVLMALGELLRTLHFTIGSLSIAGGCAIQARVGQGHAVQVRAGQVRGAQDRVGQFRVGWCCSR